jgi:hypothetical protein
MSKAFVFWLRIETSDGLLWTRSVTLNFHKVWGILELNLLCL